MAGLMPAAQGGAADAEVVAVVDQLVDLDSDAAMGAAGGVQIRFQLHVAVGQVESSANRRGSAHTQLSAERRMRSAVG